MTLRKHFIYKLLFANKLNYNAQITSWILWETGCSQWKHRLPLSPVLLHNWTPLPWKYGHLLKKRGMDAAQTKNCRYPLHPQKQEFSELQLCPDIYKGVTQGLQYHRRSWKSTLDWVIIMCYLYHQASSTWHQLGTFHFKLCWFFKFPLHC